MQTHNRDKREELSSGHPVQYLNNISHGQNLGSSSGEPEFMAHYFFEIPESSLCKNEEIRLCQRDKPKKNLKSSNTVYCSGGGIVTLYTPIQRPLLKKQKEQRRPSYIPLQFSLDGENIDYRLFNLDAICIIYIGSCK
jgi:hypothetical protein